MSGERDLLADLLAVLIRWLEDIQDEGARANLRAHLEQILQRLESGEGLP